MVGMRRFWGGFGEVVPGGLWICLISLSGIRLFSVLVILVFLWWSLAWERRRLCDYRFDAVGFQPMSGCMLELGLKICIWICCVEVWMQSGDLFSGDSEQLGE